MDNVMWLPPGSLEPDPRASRYTGGFPHMEDSNELLIGPTNYGRKHDQPFYKIFEAAVSVVLAPKGASVCLRRLTVNDVLSHSTNNLCVNDVLSLVV